MRYFSRALIPFSVFFFLAADNVRGWEIVRKMNIWPRSEASRANVKFNFEDSFSAKDIISRHTAMKQSDLLQKNKDFKTAWSLARI